MFDKGLVKKALKLTLFPELIEVRTVLGKQQPRNAEFPRPSTLLITPLIPECAH